MRLFEFLSKATVPIAITLIYAMAHAFKVRMYGYTKNKIENKELLEFIELLASNFKFETKDWKRIYLPMIAVVTLDIFLIWYFKTLMSSYDEPL